MSISPTVRRRRLITDIRRLRETSGMSIEQAAARAGVPAGALAEIEGGLLAGHLLILDALLRVYGVPAVRAQEVGKLWREASEPGWWQTAHGAVLEGTRELISFEEEADWEHEFSTTIIPGLVQTQDFARAVITATLPDATPDAIEGGLEIRLRRQQRLGDLAFRAIISEEALLRPVGGAGAMKAQLEHLVSETERPEVTIQVLGREQGAHPGMSGMFTVVGTDPPEEIKAVYLEGTQWDSLREDPAAVGRYERVFAGLGEIALSPEDSRRRLLTLSKDLLT
jgi:transcriptional regulator with XRE-family HTH domain